MVDVQLAEAVAVLLVGLKGQAPSAARVAIAVGHAEGTTESKLLAPDRRRRPGQQSRINEASGTVQGVASIPL